MRKISNSVTGRTVLPIVSGGAVLTYASVNQTVLTAATATLLAAAYSDWRAANAAQRPITLTLVTGDVDAIPKLLVEYTALEVSDPLNSLISQTFITGVDAPTLVAALQTWKDANTLQKIVRVTRLTGTDGSVGLLVEYGIDAAITNLVNNQISQTAFYDDGEANTSFDQYVDWKNARKTYDCKPYRLTYIIASNGGCGILVEYTPFGTGPGISQLQLAFIRNDATYGGAPGFAANLQGNKTDNPGSQIYRLTPIFQGLLVESTLNGNTPNNNLVTQQAYAATPGASDATDAYQADKLLLATKPIRITAMTWGNGANVLIAEYIS